MNDLHKTIEDITELISDNRTPADTKFEFIANSLKLLSNSLKNYSEHTLSVTELVKENCQQIEELKQK